MEVVRACALALAAASLIAANLAPALAQSPIVLKLATATINDSQHEWMKRFAVEVEKESAGRIKCELYPASQLGPIPRMIENTQFGAIQGIVVPPEFLAGIDSRFALLSMPALFPDPPGKDMRHANALGQDPEFTAAFFSIGANKGLLGIGLFVAGPLSIATRTKTVNIAGLAGKKIRIFGSPVQESQIKRLGATPVPMTLGEVLPSLQQGTIDGTMSSMNVLASLHTYDAAKYVLETHQAMAMSLTLVSKLWFDKLPADLQKVVTEAGKKVSADLLQWILDDDANAHTVWTKNGGEITALSDADRTKMMQVLAPVGSDAAVKDPKTKAMYDLLLKAVERTKP